MLFINMEKGININYKINHLLINRKYNILIINTILRIISNIISHPV